VHGQSRKGKVYDRDRVLVSEEFIKLAKRKHVPPPGHYNVQLKQRVLLGKADKSEKRPAFIDAAVNQSMSAPSHKYEDLAAWKAVHKRTLAFKMIPEPKSKPMPTKSKEPDCGSYYKDNMDKLTRPKSFDVFVSETPKQTFSDVFTRMKKFVPSPGLYKIEPKAFDRITRSSYTLKSRRH
jgi:hypothetical protein